MCVCVYVCMCIQIKKKVFLPFEKKFFPKKVWILGVTWAILEVSNTTPSCRKPDKPSKNRVFFGLSRQYCEDLLIDFDENGPKESHGQYKNFQTQSRAAGNPINHQKRGFSEFREKFSA